MTTCVEFTEMRNFFSLRRITKGDLRVYEVDDSGEEAVCGTMANQTLKEIGYLKES